MLSLNRNYKEAYEDERVLIKLSMHDLTRFALINLKQLNCLLVVPLRRNSKVSKCKKSNKQNERDSSPHKLF